ncbi:suppressor of lurcher protein 1-like isoform X3 [Saccostrea cucullata]
MNYSVLASLFLLPTFFLSVDLIGPEAERGCLSFDERAKKKGCECVVYQSTGQPGSRTFHSPNYTSAQTYPRGIICILFSFIGDVNETVEITFIDFNLHPKVNNRCPDFLKLYLDERAEVNEQSISEYDLCGNMSDLPQKTFYSKGRSLHMEFHTAPDGTLNNSYKGFAGKFSFVDSKEFQTTMKPVSKDPNTCSYTDQHNDNSLNKGRFFSPRYPQNFPPWSSCSYQFFARPGEIIQINFLVFQLSGNASSCKKDEDYIELFENRNKTERIAFICGTKSVPTITSHNNYLSVYFHSKSNSNKKGFAATYEYKSIDSIVHKCSRNITQASSPAGTISSPRYSNQYPADVTCTYDFYANPGERVQIKFTHFNLFKSQLYTQEGDCKLEDSVSIYIFESYDEASIMFCGDRLPLQYMSVYNWLRVRFVSLPGGDKGQASGFEFQYKFRKDFGITTGLQSMGDNGRPLCKFLYNSTVQKVGNFTTPNYPGYYPSYTHCEYVFRGEPGERVTITLDNFDVGRGGVCEGKNDHVTFTAFAHDGPDRGFKPICGVMQSLITKRVSDGAYFRVLMSSFDNYEHTGFLGRYEFSPDYKVIFPTTSSPEKRSGSQSSSSDIPVLDSLCVIMLSIISLSRVNMLS